MARLRNVKLVHLVAGDVVPIDHTLKTWPDVFQEIWDGNKRHEFRRNDRGYESGQVLHLREFEPAGERYSGRDIVCRIRAISHGPEWGIPEGYAVFTIEVLPHVKIRVIEAGEG